LFYIDVYQLHEWNLLIADIESICATLDSVKEILTSKGRTLVQGALAWIWGKSGNTIPIPGFKSIKQVEENAKAMDFGPLSPNQMDEIDQILKQSNC
jgi:aryl-alcohol dehydrogenase-like predicted oxidoreductase